ncbi:MAG: SDR family oxidoreductase [Bacteroidales bacterium]|nr:SDR family oxidoreductase [Bacteroidales bacterium]
MKPLNFDDLKEKVCVLTGGGGAIGASLAEFLARGGVRIAILDLNGVRAKEVAEQVKRKTGTPALGIKTNVLEKESLEQARATIHKEFGKVDFLINAAGGNSPKGTTEAEFLESVSDKDLENSIYGLDIEGFRWVFDLNLSGTLLPTLVFTKDMLELGSGAVVNFSSMSALRPLTRVGAYSAAKAAVTNLTEWLAVHLAKKNIRINAVAPGFFVGEQNRFLLFDEKTGKLSPRGNKIIRNTPMGRFGDYEEIHGTVAFLLSGMASFITGVTVPIDGGFNAYSGV